MVKTVILRKPFTSPHCFRQCLLAPLAKKFVQGSKFVVVAILPYMLSDDAIVLKVLKKEKG